MAHPIQSFQRKPPTLGDKLPSFTSKELGVTVYWRPDTMAIRDKYFSDISDRKMTGFVKALFWKALNADGSRMFRGDESGNDYKVLLHSDKVDEIVEIVSAMLADGDDEISIEEAEKN